MVAAQLDLLPCAGENSVRGRNGLAGGACLLLRYGLCAHLGPDKVFCSYFYRAHSAGFGRAYFCKLMFYSFQHATGEQVALQPSDQPGLLLTAVGGAGAELLARQAGDSQAHCWQLSLDQQLAGPEAFILPPPNISLWQASSVEIEQIDRTEPVTAAGRLAGRPDRGAVGARPRPARGLELHGGEPGGAGVRGRAGRVGGPRPGRPGQSPVCQ